MIRKVKDWRGWLDGLRSKLFQAAGTAGTTMLTSNGIASMGIDSLKDVGMNWKQALFQFAVHIGFATFDYMKSKPDPDVITLESETTTTTKTASGTESVKTTATTTTIPKDTV